MSFTNTYFSLEVISIFYPQVILMKYYLIYTSIAIALKWQSYNVLLHCFWLNIILKNNFIRHNSRIFTDFVNSQGFISRCLLSRYKIWTVWDYKLWLNYKSTCLTLCSYFLSSCFLRYFFFISHSKYSIYLMYRWKIQLSLWCCPFFLEGDD